VTRHERRLALLERQIDRLNRRLDDLRHLSDRFTRWRLGLFAGGVLLIWLALNVDLSVGYSVAVLWLIVFLWIARRHGQVKRAIVRHRLWRQIKSVHTARMRLAWDDLPPAYDAVLPQGHPFVLDLDLAGPRSIHHLLDTCIAVGGSARLLEWLLNQTPDLNVIQRRQAIIAELIPVVGFRDRIALNAALTARESRTAFERWDGDHLMRWLEQQRGGLNLARPLAVLAALSLANMILFGLHQAGILPPFWLGSLTLYLALSVFQWRDLGDLFPTALSLNTQLSRFVAVLRVLEVQRHRDRPHLDQARHVFLEGRSPSTLLRRTRRIVAAASLQGNVIFWLAINTLVPWDVFFAVQLEQQRRRLKAIVPQWLDAWYEIEAVCALAHFAYLNPGAVFPALRDRSGPILVGQGLGHPLISPDRRIANDFHVDHAGAIAIITGSNMAGKSSFLRTLGVNLALAYAGGAVLAVSFEARLLRIFACIRVTDSVVDGFSYFYAEVRRLKALLGALKADDPLPLFFLIDEIFRGTNNRERLIGAQSYIRALAGGHGAGLISTHDLELIRLADQLPQVSNYHFREEVIEGQMAFDYQLRPGPSPTTNALRIMRLAGLPVDDGTEHAAD
jgi:hypothetical protein